MEKYSYEFIFEIIKKEIPVNSNDSVFGITFIAGPGTGKSYVSNLISKKTGLYITANDRTIYLLENKVSHIIDANMEFFGEVAENNFKNFNAKLYFVELICDEQEILKRISKRADSFGNTDNYSRATVDTLT